MARRRWIEQMMDAERGPSRAVLLTAGCMLIMIVLFLGHEALSPFLDGVYKLDAAKVGGANAYVLCDAGSPAPFWTMLALFALLAAAAFGFAHSSALRRRTSLGRRIAREGNFRQICREINRQAANPLFQCFGAVVLKDWVVLRGYDARTHRPTDFAIAPARDVTRLDVALDADGDGMHACRFDIAGRSNPFTIHLDRDQAGRLRSAVRRMAGREMAL